MESQIVGYESIPLDPGNQLIKGVMFKDPAKTTLDIQSIKMSNDTIMDEATKIWWWNGAFYDEKATWTYECDEDGNYLDKDGNIISEDEYEEKGNRVWGDVDWIRVSKTFNRGESFWIQLGSDNESSAVMVPAGELVTSDSSAEFVAVPLDVEAGQVQVTHPMPIGSYTLDDIAMDENTLMDEATKIWWWNGAFYDEKATWTYECDEDGNYLDKDGNIISEDEYEEKGNRVWGDVDWIRLSHNFAAGEGFWIQLGSENDNCSVLFRNPLYKAK